jgi:hypothetical protein
MRLGLVAREKLHVALLVVGIALPIVLLLV